MKFVAQSYLRLDNQARRKRKGVSYKVRKSENGSRQRAKVLKGAFIAESTKSGREFVLRREGKQRKPIMPLFTITPTTMFDYSSADESYEEAFIKKFEERYWHHTKRVL